MRKKRGGEEEDEETRLRRQRKNTEKMERKNGNTWESTGGRVCLGQIDTFTTITADTNNKKPSFEYFITWVIFHLAPSKGHCSFD